MNLFFFKFDKIIFNQMRLFGIHTSVIVLFVLPFRNTLFERVKVIRATRHAIIAHSAYIQSRPCNA